MFSVQIGHKVIAENSAREPIFRHIIGLVFRQKTGKLNFSI